jgi:hypothetical protein
METVTISLKEFEAMVAKIQEFEKAVEYLNNQIKEYNKLIENQVKESR